MSKNEVISCLLKIDNWYYYNKQMTKNIGPWRFIIQKKSFYKIEIDIFKLRHERYERKAIHRRFNTIVIRPFISYQPFKSLYYLIKKYENIDKNEKLEKINDDWEDLGNTIKNGN